MAETTYRRLQQVLDTLPNGFPESDEGLDIKILKRIFTEEEAQIFCILRLTYETAEQITERTGWPLEGLNDNLIRMWEKGQIFGIDFGGVYVFRMAAWVFGIYEFQLKTFDREMAELCKAYEESFAHEFFNVSPPLMHVLPVEEEVDGGGEVLPFDQVSSIIEKGKSFGLADCICKVEQGLLGHPCTKPVEVCISIAPIPGFFDNHPWAIRPITKEKAFEVLKTSEEAGLVHMTNNFQNGHFYICNCCGCCCGILRNAKKFGVSHAIHSNFTAVIDEAACLSCGLCAEERCQLDAIEEVEDAYRINPDKCIGCGLCISTCPAEAVSLVRKAEADIIVSPKNEMDWYAQRGEFRGVDYSEFA
ncbi:4Fe-4S dicluster-binding protein [Desulfoluna sp.]|uniref:4Fe-4S dicluster-binding protein n=1 Tax=Desulfoluna sp. TaxID=2045199 RepID=UPI00262510DE|nr:4Fe-4S dicluster-binding protein [Desulfoluna sp.]